MFKEFAKGLSITLKHLLPGNCTTVQYPKQKLEMAPRFRGTPFPRASSSDFDRAS